MGIRREMCLEIFHLRPPNFNFIKLLGIWLNSKFLDIWSLQTVCERIGFCRECKWDLCQLRLLASVKTA